MSLKDIIEENNGIPLDTDLIIENQEDEEIFGQKLYDDKDNYEGKFMSLDDYPVKEIFDIYKFDIYKEKDKIIVSFLPDNRYIMFPDEDFKDSYPLKIKISEESPESERIRGIK